MHGSPNNLRITWQFFEKDFLAHDAFKVPRDFHAFDEKYFDHFNLRVSPVRCTRAAALPLWAAGLVLCFFPGVGCSPTRLVLWMLLLPARPLPPTADHRAAAGGGDW
jgi:hypothetical protein